MKNVTHHVHSTAGVSVCYVCEGAEIKARTQAGSVLVKKARPQSLHPCVHTLCMCVCVHVCACVCMRLCVCACQIEETKFYLRMHTPAVKVDSLKAATGLQGYTTD